jgi:uncharacterized membrane protein YphA (DoxX/SURF4 family)
VSLVALRLMIGWHFYQEGVQKIPDPNWTTAGFFTGAKGPLADYFELLVYDVDGRERLNFVRTETGKVSVDPDRTLETWKQFRAKVEQYYGFDEEQKKAAEECFQAYERQLVWFFDLHHDEIHEYFHGLDRRQVNRLDPARRSVPSLRAQAEAIEMELSGQVARWLHQIDKLWRGYGRDLNAIATEEQQARGPVRLESPGGGMFFGLMDTRTIDKIIPLFDTVVGAMLILGLGTRLAALAGAGFLFSICLTQWPGAPGALPVYYQAIEMFGLLVLAAVAAGQFAGLDFIVYRLYSSYRTSKQESES